MSHLKYSFNKMKGFENNLISHKNMVFNLLKASF